jgi:hypothetical protein
MVGRQSEGAGNSVVDKEKAFNSASFFVLLSYAPDETETASGVYGGFRRGRLLTQFRSSALVAIR